MEGIEHIDWLRRSLTDVTEVVRRWGKMQIHTPFLLFPSCLPEVWTPMQLPNDKCVARKHLRAPAAHA